MEGILPKTEDGSAASTQHHKEERVSTEQFRTNVLLRSEQTGGQVSVIENLVPAAAYRRVAPPRGDRRAGFGGLGPTVATLLPRGAGGLVHTDRTVLGAGGQRDLGCTAEPSLAPGDALPLRRPTGNPRRELEGGRETQGRKSARDRKVRWLVGQVSVPLPQSGARGHHDGKLRGRPTMKERTRR